MMSEEGPRIRFPFKQIARSTLDAYLRRWKAGETIPVSDVISAVKRRDPDIDDDEVLRVIEAYEHMHWIKLDQSGDGAPLIVIVSEAFSRQSELTIGNLLRGRECADRLRTQLVQQRRDLAETIAAMGLSTDMDEATLGRQLATHGLAVKGVMPDLGTSFVHGIVWRPRRNNVGGCRGTGASRAEAICHGAALAFLDQVRDPEA
ncbi:MAG: hypothetical protein M3Q10_11700 [Chloroflexota bacterium]|nr:hypothetical protein [Chloroflexota bacterium]